MRRRLTWTTTATALIAAAAVSPAFAGSHTAKRFPTRITIKADEDAGTIKGTITSDRNACFRNREVILNVDGEDVTSANATAGGHVKLSGGLPPGDYAFRVAKLRVSDKVVCGAARSNTISIEGPDVASG